MQYLHLIQTAKYEQVGTLWAEDAVFYNPLGTVIQGRQNIQTFYANFLQRITPVVRAASVTEDASGRACVMELESKMRREPDGTWKTDAKAPFSLSAIDRFTINDRGMIQHMIVYTAPPNRWMAP
ncbi:MAG: nuclear transport factor 2 family protein [Rhodospirillales bacterium]